MPNTTNNFDFKDIHLDSSTSSVKNFLFADSQWFRENISKSNRFFFKGLIFGLCINGNIDLKIDTEDYNISSNDFLTLLPNRLVEVVPKDDNFRMAIIVVSTDFFTEFPTLNVEFNIKETFTRHPIVRLTEQKYNLLLEYFKLMVEKCNQTDTCLRENIVKYLLYSMILEVIPVYNDTQNTIGLNSSKDDFLTKKFMKLVREHCKEEHKVEFYADKLCMSPKYLSMKIKDLTGSSVHQIINENIISESKILLKTTDQSIIEISETLNFTNPSFFVKFFKDNVGTTPLKYRNNSNGKEVSTQYDA